MASTSMTILTTTLAGASVTAKANVGSSETMTISATTAQAAMDFATMVVRVLNNSATNSCPPPSAPSWSTTSSTCSRQG